MASVIEQSEQTLDSAFAGEDVRAGVGVEIGDSGYVYVFDYDSAEGNVPDGWAADPHTADYVDLMHVSELASGLDDFQVYKEDGSFGENPDKVPYGGFFDGNVVNVAVANPSGDDEAPEFNANDTVGFIDPEGTADSPDEDFAGRLVQDGYEDDGGTEYNAGDDEFLPVGRVADLHHEGNEDTDGRIRRVKVRVRKEL